MADEINFILDVDSYKLTHRVQYPANTENVFSFFESRGGEYPETVLFGLQYILLTKFVGIRVTKEHIDEAEEIAELHFGAANVFSRAPWEHMVVVHGGKLPLRIKAVPEGTVVTNHNALMTVEVTCPMCFWLTNYAETQLSQVWYPSTVATQSREMKKIIADYARRTSDDQFIDFKLHDFGFRGSTSYESSAIGGAAHLVNFQGTDTLSAVMLLRKYYDAEMPGFSIPAAEHSTITSWGQENEVKAFENMLDQYPTGLVAVVSDSYDIFKACSDLWGTALKEKILARDGTVVVRPDSGDPAPTVVKVLNILGEKFGVTKNSKGYKVLPSQIRVIQGDGIDIKSLRLILEKMENAEWAVDNIAFGSGGGLLQKVNRDTLKFAFKASAILIDGEWHDVWKDPITDPGKTSKKGRLALTERADGFHTVLERNIAPEDNKLVLVFENGELFNHQTLADIRSRASLR